MRPLLTIAILCVGCGRHEPQTSTPSHVDELRVEYAAKRAELATLTDDRGGWPSVMDCDAVLWAGEAAAAGLDVDLARAEHAPGEVHRRPAKPCWTPDAGDTGSRTTISRDMLLGYLAGVWAQQDVGALQRLAAYGEAHDWVMGQPLADGRTWMGFNLQGLLGRMLAHFGADKAYRYLPTSYAVLPAADYERHLLALGVYLQGDVSQGVDGEMMARLDELEAAEPDNFFFSAVRSVYTGDATRAVELLLADAPAPTYVRGDQPEAYALAHWLLAAKIVLDHAE